jgi:hypothetical protein
MHGSRVFRLTLAVLVLAVCASGAVALGASRPTVAGTWAGKYNGSYSGTFTIHWRLVGSTLRGTIALSSPRGTYGITGSVNRGAIKFGAVAVGATYTGTVIGKNMTGRYKTGDGGSGSWSAHKVS